MNRHPRKPAFRLRILFFSLIPIFMRGLMVFSKKPANCSMSRKRRILRLSPFICNRIFDNMIESCSYEFEEAEKESIQCTSIAVLFGGSKSWRESTVLQQDRRQENRRLSFNLPRRTPRLLWSLGHEHLEHARPDRARLPFENTAYRFLLNGCQLHAFGLAPSHHYKRLVHYLPPLL